MHSCMLRCVFSTPPRRKVSKKSNWGCCSCHSTVVVYSIWEVKKASCHFWKKRTLWHFAAPPLTNWWWVCWFSLALHCNTDLLPNCALPFLRWWKQGYRNLQTVTKTLISRQSCDLLYNTYIVSVEYMSCQLTLSFNNTGHVFSSQRHYSWQLSFSFCPQSMTSEHSDPQEHLMIRINCEFILSDSVCHGLLCYTK